MIHKSMRDQDAVNFYVTLPEYKSDMDMIHEAVIHAVGLASASACVNMAYIRFMSEWHYLN